MTVHVGIIDSDPIRLITPLLDNRVTEAKMIFVGDISQQTMFQRLQQVLSQRNIESEFYDIPQDANTLLIKQSAQKLAKKLTTENEKSRTQCKLWFKASTSLLL